MRRSSGAAARARVPPPLRRPHDLARRQRDRAGRARVRRPRPDGLEDRPRPDPRRREIPLIVFLLVGGIWADRLPRNRVMVGANVVSALRAGLAATLLITGNAEIWHLAALAAVNGGASAFFFPASAGVDPADRARAAPAAGERAARARDELGHDRRRRARRLPRRRRSAPAGRSRSTPAPTCSARPSSR